MNGVALSLMWRAELCLSWNSGTDIFDMDDIFVNILDCELWIICVKFLAFVADFLCVCLSSACTLKPDSRSLNVL